MAVAETLNKPMGQKASVEGKPSPVSSHETVTGFNPTDVQVDQTPAPQYTESQLGFQRLLLRDHKDESQPGDGWKRLGMNATILVGMTAADLVEGNIIEHILRDPLKTRTELSVGKLAELNKQKDGDDISAFVQKNAALNLEGAEKPVIERAYNELHTKLEKSAKTNQGLHSGAEFLEEWLSDSVYAAAANGWVRTMTGMDDAKYVSETAAVLADWANVVSQVWFEDMLIGRKDPRDTTGKTPAFFPLIKGKGPGSKPRLAIKLAYPTMDFINPVNIEAAFRVLEEVPVLGDGVAWAH